MRLLVQMVKSLIPLLLVYPLLILLFHRGEYPSTPWSPKGTGRQLFESAVVLGALLAVRLLKEVYTSVFTWATYTITYLALGLGLLLIMEKPREWRDIKRAGFVLPTNRQALTLFTGLLVLQMVGGVARHIYSGTRLPYLNMYFISGVVVGPFVEETLLRGLIQTRLEAILGASRSWLVSGTLFGFYHLWAHYLVAGRALTFIGCVQLITVSLFGMLLGVVFTKTRSLLPPLLLHAANNFVATQSW
jgi:membrane protease YdiL (CAAX protease family)